MPKYRSYREALSVPMQIQVYRQVDISESALRLQREPKNHFNYLVPIRLAALTRSHSIFETVFLKNELSYIRNAHFDYREHHICARKVDPKSHPESAGIL